MRRDFIYDRPRLSHSAFPRPWSVSLTASVKCSKGVDVCFDNTGGPIHDAVMRNLSIGAQVIICGRIALAAQFSKPDIGERFMGQLIMSRASIHGFLVFDWWHRRDEALRRLAEWPSCKKNSFQRGCTRWDRACAGSVSATVARQEFRQANREDQLNLYNGHRRLLLRANSRVGPSRGTHARNRGVGPVAGNIR
jgi:hypothetical protein